MRYVWDPRKERSNRQKHGVSFEEAVTSFAGGDVMKKATERRKTTRHAEPSEASLKEIPEVDFTKARARKNPYAARIAKEGITVQVGRGRPRKLAEVGGTSPRSVRFPDEVWHLLEARAKRRGLTLHAALREAILAWIERAA